MRLKSVWKFRKLFLLFDQFAFTEKLFCRTFPFFNPNRRFSVKRLKGKSRRLWDENRKFSLLLLRYRSFARETSPLALFTLSPRLVHSFTTQIKMRALKWGMCGDGVMWGNHKLKIIKRISIIRKLRENLDSTFKLYKHQQEWITADSICEFTEKPSLIAKSPVDIFIATFLCQFLMHTWKNAIEILGGAQSILQIANWSIYDFDNCVFIWRTTTSRLHPDCQLTCQKVKTKLAHDIHENKCLQQNRKSRLRQIANLTM